MKKTIDLALLEQYLRGELDEIQKNEIANRLKKDIPFAKQYQDLKDIQDGIRCARLKNTLAIIQSWESLVNENEADFEQEVSNMIRIEKSKGLLKTIKGFDKKASANSKKIIALPYWWGIAAGVILTVGVALFVMLPETKSESAQQAIDYFDKYPIIGNNRGGVANEIKETAYEKYFIGDFKEAILNLNHLAKSGDSLAVFYLGIAQLGNKNPKAAAMTFHKFITQYNLLKTPTHWYLGLCYLEMEHFNKATFYFEQVINANEFKAEESITLKNWVKNTKKKS